MDCVIKGGGLPLGDLISRTNPIPLLLVDLPEPDLIMWSFACITATVIFIPSPLRLPRPLFLWSQEAAQLRSCWVGVQIIPLRSMLTQPELPVMPIIIVMLKPEP